MSSKERKLITLVVSYDTEDYIDHPSGWDWQELIGSDVEIHRVEIFGAGTDD